MISKGPTITNDPLFVFAYFSEKPTDLGFQQKYIYDESLPSKIPLNTKAPNHLLEMNLKPEVKMRSKSSEVKDNTIITLMD